MAAVEQVLRLKPDLVQAHCNRGNLLRDLCRLDEALAAYETALSLDPRSVDAHSNRLLTLHYRDADNQPRRQAALRAFAACFPAAPHRPTPVASTATSAPEPERRLRLGYVSGDLRRHPVGYFLDGVLQHHDRAAFELHAFSNHPSGDALTERLRAQVDGWHPISALSDTEAAALIRAQGIDLLVDTHWQLRY